MSEENPFDDIDNILEYISENIIFDNQIQLDLFLFEFASRLKDSYKNIKNPEPPSTDEDEDEDFLELAYKQNKIDTTKSQYLWASKYEPKIKVNIDEEGFYSLK